jgi:hypothetical protein
MSLNNIFSFEIIISCILIVINLLSIITISNFFHFFDFKKYTSLVFYIFFHASIVTLLMGFNAFYAKNYIYLITLFNCFFSLIIFSKNKNNFYNFYIKHNLIFLFTSAVLLFTIVIYTFISIKYYFIYNGHDAYLFGIPFEVFDSNYSSRIRIFDNYPYEWPKFHFFNGAVSAVILAPIITKNIFIYKFSKLIFLCITVLSLQEYWRPKNKSLLLISIILIILSNVFSWMFYINGFISIYLFLIILIILNKVKIHFDNTLIILLIFSILFFSLSTVRNLIPGFTMLFLVLYTFRNVFENNIVKYIIPIGIILSAIFSMIYFGKTPSKESTILFDYRNYFQIAWNDLFIFRNFMIQLNDFFKSAVPFFIKVVFITAIIVYIFLKREMFRLLFLNFKIIDKLFYIFIIIINAISIIFYSNKFLFAISSLSLYVIVPTYISQQLKNIFGNEIALILNVFILTSLLQIFFISPISSVLNAILIDFLLIYIFVKKLNLQPVFLHDYLFVLFVFIPFFSFHHMLFPSYKDRSTFTIKIENKNLKKESFNITESKSFKEYYIVNLAILGKRMFYSNSIPDSLSISKRFVNK